MYGNGTSVAISDRSSSLAANTPPPLSSFPSVLPSYHALDLLFLSWDITTFLCPSLYFFMHPHCTHVWWCHSQASSRQMSVVHCILCRYCNTRPPSFSAVPPIHTYFPPSFLQLAQGSREAAKCANMGQLANDTVGIMAGSGSFWKALHSGRRWDRYGTTWGGQPFQTRWQLADDEDDYGTGMYSNLIGGSWNKVLVLCEAL